VKSVIRESNLTGGFSHPSIRGGTPYEQSGCASHEACAAIHASVYKSAEYVQQYAAWSTDTEGCSWDPEDERESGEELPEGALDMEEDDLEEALEAAALDELEEDW
jgi:hypothetical protein